MRNKVTDALSMIALEECAARIKDDPFTSDSKLLDIFHAHSAEMVQDYEAISFLREVGEVAERLHRPFLLGKRIINILESKNISKDPAMGFSPSDGDE